MSAMSVRAATVVLGLSLAATAHAGSSRVGVAVVVPVGPMAPFGMPVAPVFIAPSVAPVFIAPSVAPVFATTIIQPPVAPMFVPSFVPGFAPGFVPVAPQMVVTPVVPVLTAPAVVPHVPVIAPSAPLFFAPPVQTVISPSVGGQVIIIRGSGF
jgi:hypothetical protein